MLATTSDRGGLSETAPRTTFFRRALSGSAGDRIIVRGAERLMPGQAVQVADDH